MRPPTLNIFPSEPMHVEPSSSNSNANMELLSPETSGSRKTNLPKQVFSGSEPSKTVKPERNHGKGPTSSSEHEGPKTPDPKQPERNHGKGPTSSSEHEGPKTPDPKTLRRLAQNREAARKSRLRKKAYIQQLESSRIRLSQMEQELQRARNQGMFFGGGAVMGGEQNIPISMNSITSDIWRIICSLTREVVNGISWKCSWV
ncbi:bZIP transcription factor TGA10-like isoform X2 [Vicia villosa]|uniref:bZIP transcription factor TGA10-like isoform X2 n=1 Tax=Vicia villosa TaxID=3911 RepID=UPI00273B8AAF|nr:bZIP transcription factor TGA10-like isoform X2 [Vicia villosa]